MERGRRVENKCLALFFGWPEDREFVEKKKKKKKKKKMRFGASYGTFWLRASKIVFKAGSVKFANSLSPPSIVKKVRTTPSQCDSQRKYSLVAPCRRPDLTSLALLGSVSGQRLLSKGPLPGYKTVSKWRLQLQDSAPFPLLSQRYCTTLHTSASLGCYLLFALMPDCPLAPLGQVWQQYFMFC